MDLIEIAAVFYILGGLSGLAIGFMIGLGR